jgi:hypothetical protein
MRVIGIILCLLVFQFSSLSQSVKKINITDAEQKPVPYATIEVWKKNKAFFANENGLVDLSAFKLNETDTLIFSAIGFKDFRESYARLNSQVVLQRQIVDLPEVIIYDGEWIKENWGTKEKPGLFFNSFGCGYGLAGPGSQIGKVVKRKPGVKNAYLYKISFFTTYAEKTRTPVRLRIYAIDKNGLPGKDLLMSSKIEKLDKGSGWLSFDLSEDPVRFINDSIIIAAEYFETDAKNYITFKYTYKDKNGQTRKETGVRYGGSFSGNREGEAGDIIEKAPGLGWLKFVGVTKLKCENLVVQVWVKYY